MFAISFLIASIIGVIVGAVMVIKGYVGKRVGDHPHCRSCGFDLFGQPEPLDRCPECGVHVWQSRGGIAFGDTTGDHPICRECGLDLHDLPQPFRKCPNCRATLNRVTKGIEIGERVRDPWRMTTGGVIVLMCVLFVFGFASSAFSFKSLAQYKPTWWLKFDAGSSRKQVMWMATSQLVARALARPEEASDIADFFLDQMHFELQTRPTIRKGDRWPIRMSGRYPPVQFAGAIEKIECDGEVLPDRIGRTIYESIEAEHLVGLSAGKHSVRFHLAYWINGIEGRVRRQVIERELTVVAPPDDSVVLKVDPALREAMRSAMGLASTQPSDAPRLVVGSDRVGLEWPTKTTALPIALHAKVVVIDQDRNERNLQTLRNDAGSIYSQHYFPVGFDRSWEGFEANTVDLVFRPDPTDARYDVSLDIYGEELIVRGVQVIWKTSKPVRLAAKIR